MKRIQLPQDKSFLLAINIGFVAALVLIWNYVKPLVLSSQATSLYVLVPFICLSGLLIRYVFWVRSKSSSSPTPTIDEVQAGKQWDAVVNELRNR